MNNQMVGVNTPCMTFGQISLIQFKNDDPRKFRPLVKINDPLQQCLLDHLWNLKTIEQERRNKQRLGNCIAPYFSKIQQKPLSKNFFCYVVFKRNFIGFFKHNSQV